MDSNQIRTTFLEFFKNKGHLIVPSAPMVVKNDPTLMFTNAGMNQFKDIFLGNSPIKHNRVSDSQKCLRVSGKHNDLEEVGHDTYHHTMFEMLGNWSFGDYFKKEAIAWAWELLVDVYGLPKDRLYATVFEGSPEEGIDRDSEAYNYWKQFLPEDHILLGNKHDNFWEMGDTGPCGPCSEIHYDLRNEEERAKLPGRELVNAGHPQVIEIWNLVFMQFNRKANGQLEPLPSHHVDTGMGFERLCMVLQGKQSNYDTDVFQPTIQRLAAMAGKLYDVDPKADVAMRVIADHLRAIAFSIADGQLPSNVKAGYVIRRILRRAVRYGYTYLGFNEPFMCKLVDGLVQQMGNQFPELKAQQELITKVIAEEESAFLRTLATGINLMDGVIAKAKADNKDTISGSDAFLLYDTYGFPIDLTIEMVEDAGMTLDRSAFDQEMQEQKTRAREARKALGDLGWAGVEFGKDIPSTEFVGYDHDTVEDAKVVALVVEDELAEELMTGVDGIVVLDKTPFYAEMGGQVADHGVITCGGAKFEVNNVQKNKGGKFMHYGKVVSGTFKVGETVTASIDAERRKGVRRAHSATHLLDAALKKVLGDHVHQAGSLVEPDRLRFDFTHFEAITPEQLAQVDKLVNDAILEGIPVVTEVLPIEEAKKKGAVAMFGEKYSDVVRVVEMGGVSMEFCGGTHVDNTAKVGPFRIKSEASVASGVRRIEATVGQLTLDTINRNQQVLFHIAQMFKTNPGELENRLEQQMNEMKDLRHELEKFKEQASLGEARSFLASAKTVGELKVITAQRDGMDAAAMRKQGDFLRDKEPGVVGVLASVNDGKVTLLAVCGKDAVAKGVKAGDIIKAIAPICGGKGGGKPDSAMGGGTEVSKVDDALAAVDDFVAGKL